MKILRKQIKIGKETLQNNVSFLYYRKVLFFNKKECKNKRHNEYASKIYQI